MSGDSKRAWDDYKRAEERLATFKVKAGDVYSQGHKAYLEGEVDRTRKYAYALNPDLRRREGRNVALVLGAIVGATFAVAAALTIAGGAEASGEISGGALFGAALLIPLVLAAIASLA